MPSKPNRNSRPPSTLRQTGPIDELIREIALARQFERAALLFVVAGSSAVRQRAARQLGKELEEMGLSIENINARTISEHDIAMAIRRDNQRANKIFFIKGLRAAGANALRALNIRREYFTELRVRAVFWLSPTEELSLARSAPDFWAFRNRTVLLA